MSGAKQTGMNDVVLVQMEDTLQQRAEVGLHFLGGGWLEVACFARDPLEEDVRILIRSGECSEMSKGGMPLCKSCAGTKIY